MASSISEEEANLLRLWKLLQGPGTKAVRILFDSFFPNNTLDSKLRQEENNIRNNAKYWRLTKKQLPLIFPAVGKATSKEFDITLLIGLIRNFVGTIGHVVIPTNKDWESLPDSKDTTKGDDLVRIKFYRNEMAHFGDDVLDTATFKSHWKNIKEAISRLSGARLDHRFIQIEKMRLDNISGVREEIKSLRADMIEYINELQIPGRDSHLVEIGIWEEDNHKFVKTDAVDTIMDALQVKHCVTVIGSFKQGKSSLIRHVALQLRDDKGYNIIPCQNPLKITLWYEKDKNQIFIVDDVYGESYLEQTKMISWQDYAKFLKSILSLGRTKIIASSALHIFNDANSKCQNSIFQDPIDMNSFPLTNIQKRDMLNMHIQSLEQSEIDSIVALSDADIAEHFPLLCAMYSSYRSTMGLKLGVYNFFCNRRRIHEEFLNSLNKHDEHSYKTILIFVLLNGKVSQIDHAKKETFEKQEIKLNFLTEYLDIKKHTFYKCLENLTGTYFRKSGTMFLPIHNRIFDTLLKFSASVSQQTIIQHLNSGLLFRHAHFTSIDVWDFNIHVLIPVSPMNENIFFQRMLDVMTKRQIFKAFDHHGMNNTQFRQKFIKFIKSAGQADNTLIKQILNTKDEARTEGALPMLPIHIASYRGWADMVEMLAAYVDVNFYGVVGFSALHAACVLGDIHTVQVLINNKADVNKTATWGHVIYAINRYTDYEQRYKAKSTVGLSEKAEIPPLLVACIRKHKSLVELLLKNDACMPTNIDIIDIETAPSWMQPMNNIKSPGFILLALATINNDTDMIKLLQRYGATFADSGKVPLPNHVDIPLD